MAIQHVKALVANRSNTQQQLSAYAFRNSSEILECARTICVSGLSRLDADSLAATGKQVYEIYEKLNNLRTLIAQARYTLTDMPDHRVTIHELERLQADLTDKFVDTCTINQRLCTDTAPVDWLSYTRQVIADLRTNLGPQCRRLESFALASKSGDITEWCLYLRLCGFTDDLGNQSAERWICFSTNTASTKYSVSVHNNLCLPTNFTPQRHYTDNRNAVQTVKNLLVGEDCEALVQTLTVPIKRLQVQKLLGTDWVQSVGVDDNHVVVMLRSKVYKQHLDNVVREVCDKLATCVPHQTVVKRQQVGRNWVLRIAFVADSTKVLKNTMTIKQRQGLHLLGFDEQSITDFAQCISRREG